VCLLCLCFMKVHVSTPLGVYFSANATYILAFVHVLMCSLLLRWMLKSTALRVGVKTLRNATIFPRVWEIVKVFFHAVHRSMKETSNTETLFNAFHVPAIFWKLGTQSSSFVINLCDVTLKFCVSIHTTSGHAWTTIAKRIFIAIHQKLTPRARDWNHKIFYSFQNYANGPWISLVVYCLSLRHVWLFEKDTQAMFWLFVTFTNLKVFLESIVEAI